MRAQLGQLLHLKYFRHPERNCIGEVIFPRERLLPAHVQSAVKYLLDRHEVLRATFSGRDRVTGIEILDSEDSRLHTAFELRASLSTENERRAVLQDYIEEVRESFSRLSPPLFRYCLFDSDNQEEQRLVFIINHLICDGISSRILWRDFSWAYYRSARGELCKTRQEEVYSQFSSELMDRHRAIQLRERFQDEVLRKGGYLDIGYREHNGDLPTSTMADAVVETRHFLQDALAKIRRAAQDNGVSLAEFFLVLFVRAIGMNFGEGILATAMWFSPHFVGEWDTNVRDLVGFVAFPSPAFFKIKPGWEISEYARSVPLEMNNAMERAPGYAAAFYSGANTESIPELPTVTFNFVGEQRQARNVVPYTIAPERIRIGRLAEEVNEFALAMDVEMIGGELECTISAWPALDQGRLPSVLMHWIDLDLRNACRIEGSEVRLHA